MQLFSVIIIQIVEGTNKHPLAGGDQFLNPDRPTGLIGSSPEGHLMEGTRNSGEQAVHWPEAA